MIISQEVSRANKSRLGSVIIIILFLLIIWENPSNKSVNIDNNFINQNLKTFQIINEKIEGFNNHYICSSGNASSSRGIIENNPCWGSWIDTFNDNSAINSGMSDHIKVSNSNVTIYNSYNIDSYTKGYWRFEKGTGTIAYDETNNNNDGTIIGGTSWKTGKIGKALDFDGSGDYIDLSSPSSLDDLPISDFTVHAWIYDRHNLGTTWGTIFGAHKSGNGWDLRTFSDASGNRYLLFDVPHSLRWAWSNSTLGSISKDQWHHVAGVWDSNTKIAKLYIDGIEASYKNQISGGGSYPSDSSIKKTIGRIPHIGSGQYFNGRIDEVVITKKGLSAIEIQDIFKLGNKLNTYNANVTSKQINIPEGKHWDTFIFYKTQPANTYLNVTILNASNNQQIPGTPKYTNKGEFDISYIDSGQYPSLELNATFHTRTSSTPILNYWGVSWNASETWQDTFYGGLKVESVDKVNNIDGEAQFQNGGFITSKPIYIPDKHYFDTLIINKSEPPGSSLKVTILDAQSGNPITNYQNLPGTNIDISGINPHDNPSIKLKATYTSSGSIGKLFDWSVNWTENTKPKIEDIKSVQTVKRMHTAKIAFNLSDFEDSEDNLNLFVSYKSPYDTVWKTNYLSIPNYVNDHWEIMFTPTVEADFGSYLFKFTCEDSYQYQDVYSNPYEIKVISNTPNIINITTSNYQVNRTKSLGINIDVFDIEKSSDNLIIDIVYKSLIDTNWQSDYISSIKYDGIKWVATFSPLKNAEIGIYSLNISCNNNYNDVFEHIEIEVKNNKPILPNAEITPTEPKTTDDLIVIISNPIDVETPPSKIDSWYYWYKFEIYMPEFDNLTTLPSSVTRKGDIWRCDVYPFDGDEFGKLWSAEIIILNSPPELIKQFDSFEIYEDSGVILENKLMEIFKDADGDKLIFSVTGQNNVIASIIQKNGTITLTPQKNWFGTEILTFYAKEETLAMAEETLLLTVNPTNDLPRIKQIGSQIIFDETRVLEFVTYQDALFNLSILVEDIDGDVERGMIQYELNITERDNLYFRKSDNSLVINPNNADVGLHLITIKITDNNETPTMFISQRIKITIKNINDPSTIQINKPNNGTEFLETDIISFSCIVSDIDFLTPNSNEELTYRWSSNLSVNNELGKDQKQFKITSLSSGYFKVEFNVTKLTPGNHRVTIKVTDKNNSGGSTFVDIVVKEVAKEKDHTSEHLFSNVYLWLGFIVIIIIIFLIIVFTLIIKQKKRKDLEKLVVSDDKVLQPDASYMSGLSTSAQSPRIKLPQPQAISRPTIPFTPRQELLAPSGPFATTSISITPTKITPAVIATTPPAIAAPAPKLPAPQQHLPSGSKLSPTKVQSRTDSELTPQQKIKLLEERLIRGEISEKTFLDFKIRLEFEAKLNKPTPQLPPLT